jgi:L-aspartate oxidase
MTACWWSARASRALRRPGAAPAKVLVLTEAPLNQGCSSAWAQGGWPRRWPPTTPELHAADTVAAGAGLVDAAMARLLAEEGPAAVRRLAELGAPFDRTADGGFAQSLEAAHGKARVARVEGRPGRPRDHGGGDRRRPRRPAHQVRTGASCRPAAGRDGRIRGVAGRIGGQTSRSPPAP